MVHSRRLKEFVVNRNLQNVVFLEFGKNHFTGAIPESLGNLSELGYLSMTHNNLQGHIPSSLGNCKTLYFLDLSTNNLSGSLPPEIIGLSALSVIVFSIYRNNIEGKIPLSLCNATKLDILVLGDNHLQGSIPSCLIAMTPTLGVLNLGRNNLGGTIPNGFGEGCRLNTLDFSGNSLQGQVPRSLANCKKLKVLDLEDNQLNGSIPCQLKTLSELQVLILKSNKFSGTLACQGRDSMWPLLQILDLASNNFSGEIKAHFTSNWRFMMSGTKELQSEPDYLQYISAEAQTIYQNLVGPIPISTQLQSFNASAYQGNPGLYGPPLTPRHAPGSIPSTFQDESQWTCKSEVEWMLRGAQVGFPVGVTIFIGPLLYMKRWRQWYCKHLGRLAMKILRLEDPARGRRRRSRRQQRQRHQA
ncbi:hypothetical protein Cgig2_018232 [Carnegiea gigantea]|uniref:Uncharacterized protein n=1 Tax=Carnegiea gigantea TaxID=171969 RepID=A0A9Q1KXX6_9CARY|nr:hypothetical protein Cgig2_018232 [Carnegiea gigantea]